MIEPPKLLFFFSFQAISLVNACNCFPFLTNSALAVGLKLSKAGNYTGDVCTPYLMLLTMRKRRRSTRCQDAAINNSRS
ncbi:hypothetical protein CFF91_07345 [Salmonella enterica]|nr:hypothetical protein [Salmonella enterica]